MVKIAINVEELEITVEAEVSKVKPQIQKLIQEMKKQISNSGIDMSFFSESIKKEVPKVKKEMKKIKEEFNPNTFDGSIMINGEEAVVKTIRGISNEFKKLSGSGEDLANAVDLNSYKEKLNSAKTILEETSSSSGGFLKYDTTEIEKNIENLAPKVNEAMSKVKEEFNPDVFDGLINGEKVAIKSISNISQKYKELSGKKISLQVDTSDTIDVPKYQGEAQDYDSVIARMKEAKATQEQMNSEQQKQPSIIERLKSGIKEISDDWHSTDGYLGQTRGKMSEMAGKFGSKLKNAFKGVGKAAQGMQNTLKSGIKTVAKYVVALIGIRSIYNGLKSLASEWMSSNDAQAKQLSANLSYLKNTLGSTLAPVINYIINLIYKAMQAVQSLIYAFTKINIFSGKTASNYASMASSASEANKETKALAGVHDEINNVSSNNDSNSGSGTTTPSLDLSESNSKFDEWANKIKAKLLELFQPIKNSWATYGEPLLESIKNAFNGIKNLIVSIATAFENVWLNGTGERTCNIILQILTSIFNIIGNITNAFANAWNNNGNGEKIVQHLWNAFNSLLNIVKLVIGWFEIFTQSSLFQWLLDVGVVAVEKIAGAIEVLAKAIEWVFEKIDTFVNFVAGNISIDELDGWSIAIGALATAIGIVVTAIIAYNTITAIATTVTTVLTTATGLLGGAIALITSPITLVILAITALIAAGLLIIKHWDDIKEAVINLKDKVVEKITNLKEMVVQKFNELKDLVKEKVSNLKEDTVQKFNDLKAKAVEIFTNIKTSITDKITAIKTGISTVLNNIKTTWTNIWTSVKNTTTNIFNGIWSGIKGVINKIIGGIESMANSVIRGINSLLKGLDGIVNSAGQIFGVDIHVAQLSEISLPRLAKGNVAYSETMAIFGEYSGASTNPEITTPQNIMKETFRDVLSEYGNNSSTQPIYLSVYAGKKKLGEILLEDLREIKRATGKDIEAIVGG